MSFQTYLDHIYQHTGETPEQIKLRAKKHGVLVSTLTATQWIEWLFKNYQLGRGYSMALWKYFVEKNWIQPSRSQLNKKP